MFQNRPESPAGRRHLLVLAGLAALAAMPARAAAPTVSLAGILGSKALLVIDGQARALGPGESAGSLKMLSVGREEAVVEIEGQRATLQLGGAPSLVGKPGSRGGSRIVMYGDSGGHFRPTGTINGQAAQFIVDTGATTVAIGLPDADRMGLPYRQGQPVRVSTANGVAQAWALKLGSVRIGDVEIFGVDAVVVPQALPFVLLGNSFLTQFQMTRTNDQMVLDKRF